MRRDDLLRRLRQSLQAEGVGDRAAGPRRSNDSEPRAHCGVVGGIRRTRRNPIGTDSRKKARWRFRAPVRHHFSTPLISTNSLLRPVPRLVSATTSATAIKLAINAYSIAVAPRSSSKSFLTDRIVIIEVVPSFVLA